MLLLAEDLIETEAERFAEDLRLGAESGALEDLRDLAKGWAVEAHSDLFAVDYGYRPAAFPSSALLGLCHVANGGTAKTVLNSPSCNYCF